MGGLQQTQIDGPVSLSITQPLSTSHPSNCISLEQRCEYL